MMRALRNPRKRQRCPTRDVVWNRTTEKNKFQGREHDHANRACSIRVGRNRAVRRRRARVRSGARRGLPGETDQDHRAARAGRPRRHARPHRLATLGRGIRAGGRGREPPRRRRRRRSGSCGARAGRRLHAVHGRPQHECGARASDAACLRSRQGSGADHPRRDVSQCAGGQSRPAGQIGARAGGLCPGQSRQAELCLAGQRRVGTPGRGAIQADRRHRHGSRALSRRRAGDPGSRSPAMSSSCSTASRCRRR